MGGGSPTINQTSFRWCNDDGTISVIGNCDTDIVNGSTTKIYVLALEIENTGNAVGRNLDYQLQYKNVTDSGAWTNIGGQGGAEDWNAADATNLTEGDAIGSVNFKCANGQGSASTPVAGEECEDGLIMNQTLDPDDWTENWLSIIGTNAVAEKVYEFRYIEDNAEVTVNYPGNLPGITMAAVAATVMRTTGDGISWINAEV